VKRTLRAEWTKLRSVRSTGWALLAIVGLTVGLGAFFSALAETNVARAGAGDNDIVRDSLVGAYLGQIGVVAFATLAITSEYATGLILATFTAMPRRGAVLAAKALLVCATVLAVGLSASVASFVLGQHLLHGGGFVPPAYPYATLGDGPVQRAVLGTALFLGALALLSLGVGAVVRHSVTAVSVLLGLLFVPLVVAPLLPEDARELVQQSTPGAGLAVQQTVERADNLPIDPWAGVGVTFAWAAGALLLALVLIRRRDA
jgi:ABC-2 type transport system permease protein